MANALAEEPDANTVEVPEKDGNVGGNDEGSNEWAPPPLIRPREAPRSANCGFRPWDLAPWGGDDIGVDPRTPKERRGVKRGGGFHKHYLYSNWGTREPKRLSIDQKRKLLLASSATC